MKTTLRTLLDTMIEMDEIRLTKFNFDGICVTDALANLLNNDIADISVDKMRDEFDVYVSEQEIIYYDKAMEYLSTNDNSLRESLEMANDHGYSLKELNSELLATLLYQRDLMDMAYTIVDEIEAAIDDLNCTFN